jgi:hypothetical protein
MTDISFVTDYVARPTRSLAEVRAGMLADLERIGEQQAAIVVRRVVENGNMEELSRKLRALNSEASALGRRLGWLDEHIGRQG